MVQNPPSKPLTIEEMDDVYALPYMRTYHPSYEKAGGVPAISEVKFSLVSNRGCFGGCSFCALTFHQGQNHSGTEAMNPLSKKQKCLRRNPTSKDISTMSVVRQQISGHLPVKNSSNTEHAQTNSVSFQNPATNLIADHRDYRALLKQLRALPGVKKVFIRSGIRFDYLLADKDQSFLKELCEYHVSADSLKVAPEHISDAVLKYMGKPENSVYRRFVQSYQKMNEKIGRKQFLVPYLMSSHPGSTLKEAVELAEFLRDFGYMPEQVQDFYPTPSTLSTCMYYTGVDPRTMEPVYISSEPT